MSDSDKPDIREVERLVRRSQAGERGAFDELVRLYQRRAMRAAVWLLADADEADEEVQAGFVKAYLGIDKLREPKRFEGWLLRIVTNAAISQRRAAGRRAKTIKAVNNYEDVETILPGGDEELKEVVQQAMAKLSEKEARAISLFGLKDLPQKEVAMIMGCSVEAVRWHVFNARKKLKVFLKEYL